MGCCESVEADDARTPFRRDIDDHSGRNSSRQTRMEPPSTAYQNQNLKKDVSTKKREVQEKGYWSDEDWSDSEEEEEKKRMGTRKRKEIKNTRLAELEKQMYPEPLFTLPEDAFNIRTMAVSNIEPSVRLHEPIYKCKTNVLGAYLKALTEKGARVFFVPPEKAQAEKWHFGIRDTDQLYPICRDGLGSSQVLYLVLKGAKRTLGVNSGVNYPHGAIEGYDTVDDSKTQRFAVYEPKHWWNVSFKAAFGQRKAPRMGEKTGKSFHTTHSDQANWKSNPEYSQQMREYFDLYYYRHTAESAKAGRIIYFCFQEVLPIVLKRLFDLNKEPDCMANVTVIALPFPEESRVTANSPDLKRLSLTPEQYATQKNVEQYKLLAQLFIPILKF